jgi:hypothetical protein
VESLEPDIEDILLHNMEDSCTELEKANMFVQVDGKPVHKASILRLYSHCNAQVGPSSPNRLKCVHRFKCYNNMLNLGWIDDESILGAPSLIVNDLVGTLIKCNKEISLMIVVITSISFGGTDVQSVSTRTLHKATTQVTVQILKLIPCEPTNDNVSDWYCNATNINTG